MDRSRRPLRIGEWIVEPELNRIRGGDETRRLPPRAMDVLIYLAQAPGTVFSPREILDGVWPDRVVEPGAVHLRISQIRRALDTHAAAQHIETIPRRGYRLVAEVASIVREDAHAQSALDLTHLRRLAVMPLRNLSADNGLDWLAGGLTEELRSSIASWRTLDVLPSVLVRGRTVENLNGIADVVIDGYLQCDGGRVIVRLDAVDLVHGRSLLTEAEFAGPADNPLLLQRQIAENVARIFNRGVVKSWKGPRDATAYAAYLRYLQIGEYGDVHEAIMHLKHTLQLDPTWSLGWAYLTNRHVQLYHWLGDQEQLKLAEEAFAHARATGVRQAWSPAEPILTAYGHADLPAAELMFRSSMETMPVQYALLMLNSGLISEARVFLEYLAEKRPYDNTTWEALDAARAMMGDVQGARAAAERIKLLNPSGCYIPVYFDATACARTGDFERSATLVDELRRRQAAAPPGTLEHRAIEFVYWQALAMLAIARGDTRQLTIVADGYLNRGEHLRAAIYLFLLEDPRTEVTVGLALQDPPYALWGWYHYMRILTAEQRDHPLIRKLAASLGLTPEWRHELCRRIAML